MSRDPESSRLVDDPDASSEVRSLLVAGATDELDYDFDRGLAAHLGAIGAIPAATAVSVGAAKGVAALSAKVWLVVAAASVAVASVVVALYSSSGAVAPSGGAGPGGGGAPVPVSSPSAPRVEPGGAAAAVETPGGVQASSSDRPVPSKPVVRGLALHGVTGAPEAESAATTHLTLEETAEAPAERAAEAAGSSVEAPRGEASAREIARDEAAAAVAAEERKARADEARRVENDRLKREMDGLVEAKRALSTDPARALALSLQGDRDFPHGIFAEEREHLLILALIRLGRRDEASRRAAPYLAQHPDSPFARRVRAALDAR